MVIDDEPWKEWTVSRRGIRNDLDLRIFRQTFDESPMGRRLKAVEQPCMSKKHRAFADRSHVSRIQCDSF